MALCHVEQCIFRDGEHRPGAYAENDSWGTKWRKWRQIVSQHSSTTPTWLAYDQRTCSLQHLVNPENSSHMNPTNPFNPRAPRLHPPVSPFYIQPALPFQHSIHVDNVMLHHLYYASSLTITDRSICFAAPQLWTNFRTNSVPLQVLSLPLPHPS
jgi:hypothetical protein